MTRRAKWNEREFDFLANVNKPLWIAFVVLVWYAHELFRSIISSSPYNVIWANFVKDPCWADPEFLVDTSAAIRSVCISVCACLRVCFPSDSMWRRFIKCGTYIGVSVGL